MTNAFNQHGTEVVGEGQTRKGLGFGDDWGLGKREESGCVQPQKAGKERIFVVLSLSYF